jgi:23S rRNA pseudouridine2605 synthase
MRLNKYLAHAGVASRRKCDEFIENGKVKVNDKVCIEFGYQVQPEDYVTCNGEGINQVEERVVFLLHKPKGYVSTSIDTHGRKCVVDLIDSQYRLFTVGRLDRDTTGAILLTNDGDLANKLMHPKYRIEKKYIIETKINILFEEYSKLPNGIKLDNGVIAKGVIKRIGSEKNKYYWEATLTEGKNREVKRIFLTLGAKVERLHRKSFAGITSDMLKPGKSRRLKKNEINDLMNS